MQTQSIKADYCSWTIVRVKPRGKHKSEGSLLVRGGIQGPLIWDKSSTTFTGWFELPARGEEHAFHEITAGTKPDAQVLRRVNIQYTFDKLYFPHPLGEHRSTEGLSRPAICGRGPAMERI